MTFELMIRRGFDPRAELMAAGIKSLPAGAACDFAGSPNVDFKVDEHEAFSIEEEKNFVQPIDDLRRLVWTRCFEVTFFQRTKWNWIHQNADQTVRSRNDRFSSSGTCGTNADIGSVFQ